MSSKRCYYETLEVERTADESRLKAAFRKLAMKWHPDKNPGDASSEVRFKEINEAYEVLKDGEKRAAYDRFGHAAFEQGAGGGGPGFGAGFASSFSDIFEDLFGMAGQRGRGGRERGADLRYNMEITLEEAFRARPRRSRSRSPSPANPVRAPAPRPAPSRRPARIAVAPAASARRRASSRWSGPVRAARAAAR